MRAALIYGAGDVRVENVPDPQLDQPTDALVRIVRACICGSDLHPYHQMNASGQGNPIGHEFLGVVEEVGSEVRTVKAGDVVISPFAWSDNTCDHCREGFQTSCRHGGFWARDGIGGAQAEAIRVPLADGTLVTAPVEENSPLLPSLLTLSDVFLTGHHAAVRGGVGVGSTVTVIGDGAVGLSAVLAAKRLGAERIILMGSHTDRTDLGREWGATEVVAERGDEGLTRVLDLTGGDGTQVVIEAVGMRAAYDMAVGVVRVGGTISRVGVPQYEEAPIGFGSLFGKTSVKLQPNPGTVKTPAENFTGDVYLDPIFSGDGASQLVVGLVRFTPSARTNWHSHANGQLLRCTDGTGLVATRDGTAIRMRAGDTVWTPAGEEHWHGGTPRTMMCHYAILDAAGDGEATTWLEPVTDEQYAAADAKA